MHIEGFLIEELASAVDKRFQFISNIMLLIDIRIYVFENF